MKKNRLYLTGLSLSLLLFLSGCVQQKNGVPTGEGWVYKLLVAPMGEIIRHFAIDQALGFGMAIILVTILVRVLIILPLGLYQSWQATYQAEKRNYFAPVFEPINQRMKEAQTQEEKLAAQTELMAAQKHYGISMFGGMGCLPILIQMPFFSALFYAARFTEGIAGQHFLWFQLDKPDLILTAIIAALYFFQTQLSMQTIPEEQKEQLKSTMYMTPILMVMFAFTSPAGVALYWLIGGVFAILQQLLVNYWLKPRLRAKVEEEYRLNPPAPYRPQATTGRPKDVTPTTAQASISANNKARNAGKQQKK